MNVMCILILNLRLGPFSVACVTACDVEGGANSFAQAGPLRTFWDTSAVNKFSALGVGHDKSPRNRTRLGQKDA